MRILCLIFLTLSVKVWSQVIIPPDKTIKLNGEWDFAPYQFLSLQDVEKGGNYSKVSVPGTWNNTKWKGGVFGGMGYGTYLKKLKLSDSLDDVTIYLYYVGLSYKIFINDLEIGGVGKPGTTKATTIPRIEPALYRIPNEFRNEEVTLIIHVANFGHQNGGIRFSPEVGNYNYFLKEKLKSVALTLLVFGGVSIIMLYHLLLFFIRSKERYSLFFSLICMSLLIHAATHGDILIVHLFPSISWAMIIKLAYVSFFSFPALNIRFIHELFKDLIPRTIRIPVIYTSMAGMIAAILLPTTLSFYMVGPFQLFVVVTGIYLLYVLAKARKNNRKGASTLLLGLGLTFISLINDVLYTQYIIDTFTSVQYGVFIYVLTMSIVLAKKFVRFINSNERLRLEMKVLNQDLERRVEIRTAELHNQKNIVKEKNEKLKQANEELNEIMAALAHDLKSPLININSLSQIMKYESGEVAHESNDMIRKIATEGVETIENIVSLKKLESQTELERNEDVDLSTLATKKVTEFESQAKTKMQEIKAEIQNEVIITSNLKYMNKIVDNLLSNAIKFSPKKTKISIKLGKINDEAVLTVQDNGPGFTAEDKESVFGKFQKLSARPTAGESSSGLGLSIVKTSVDKLKGKIALESEEGKGATFTVTFPLK